MASGALAEGGTPYLYEFHSPCFDVPLSLWDAADVIIDEEAFGCDSENEAIGYGSNSRYQLGSGRFQEGIVEGIDGFYNNLVGIFGAVRTSMGRWRCCLGGGV
jgi:hypothetical protein